MPACTVDEVPAIDQPVVFDFRLGELTDWEVDRTRAQLQKRWCRPLKVQLLNGWC